MLFNSRFTAVLLLVQVSINAANSIYPRYGANCKDFTLSNCPLDENSIIDSHILQLSQCPVWCGIVNGCLVWEYDGKACYLLETDNRDTCHVSGAPVDGNIQDCLDHDNDPTCDAYMEMNCEYTGQHVPGSPTQPGQITDEATCQFNCVMFQCQYWVYDEIARVCSMYDAGTRDCYGLSGPNPTNAPSMQDCGISGEAKLTVKTSNAITNNAVGGVLVTLLQHDAWVDQVTTNSAGQGHLTSPHGQVVLKAELEGFTMAPVTITVGDEESEKTIKLSMSPETSEPARVVMNWVHLPSDLDLHVVQLKSGSEICHCFFSHKNCGGFALDVDNTNYGENGAETITWSESDQSSQYLVFVHDYSGAATHISQFGARVALYRKGQAPTTVNIPANGSSNRYWKVGCFNSDGFTLINQIVANQPNSC